MAWWREGKYRQPQGPQRAEWQVIGCIKAHAASGDKVDLDALCLGSFLRRCSSGRKGDYMADGAGNASLAAVTVFTCHFEAGGPAPVEVIVPRCPRTPPLSAQDIRSDGSK